MQSECFFLQISSKKSEFFCCAWNFFSICTHLQTLTLSVISQWCIISHHLYVILLFLVCYMHQKKIFFFHQFYECCLALVKSTFAHFFSVPSRVLYFLTFSILWMFEKKIKRNFSWKFSDIKKELFLLLFEHYSPCQVLMSALIWIVITLTKYDSLLSHSITCRMRTFVQIHVRFWGYHVMDRWGRLFIDIMVGLSSFVEVYLVRILKFVCEECVLWV